MSEKMTNAPFDGALEAPMESRYRGHVRVDTPHPLDVAYRPFEKWPIRPSGP